MSARLRFAVAAVPMLLAVTLIPAAQPPAAKNDPPGDRSGAVIPANAFAVVSIDVAKLWDHKAFGPVREARGKLEFAWMMESLIGVAPAQLERVTAFWVNSPGGAAKEPAGPFLLVTGRKPLDQKKVAGLLTRRGSPDLPKPADPRVLAAPGGEFPHLIAIDDRTLLLGPPGADPKRLAALADLRRAGNEPFDAAMGKSALVVAVDPEALAGLPLPFGGPLVEAKTAVLTADPTGDKAARVALTLTYPTPEQARRAEPLLKAKLDELRKWLEARYKQEVTKPAEGTAFASPLLEWLATVLKGAKVTTDGATLKATADIDLNDAINRVMLAIPDSGFALNTSSAAENNVKQIVLAIINYADTFGHMPSNTYDKDGKPLLSWRVHILPYIEQNNLYKQFKLDEPWDSPHNKTFSEAILKVYTVPGRPTGAFNETYFRAFILPKGAKPENGRPYLTEGESKGPNFPGGFPDGTSNTLLVVEAAEAVPWAKPDDLPYDGKLLLPALGGPSGRYIVGFADGSTRTFRRGQVDDTNLRGIITRDGGETVNIPDR
jgi:hypothetical protein